MRILPSEIMQSPAGFLEFWFFVVVGCLSQDVTAVTEDWTTKAVKDVYENYDKNIMPPNNDSSIDVGIDVYVISLGEISEKNMDFTVNMYVRQRWQDSRLDHPNFTDDNSILINNKLPVTWVPDLFIKNDKTSKKSDVTTLNAFLRLGAKGHLTYSMRVTSTISCAMHLSRYPFDVQTCEMLFESYGHTTDELKFYWNTARAKAVEINGEIKLPEHIIENTATKDCTEVYNTTGSFSCVSVEFIFKRDVNYYVMGLFLPSILIVVLSWVAFWIDKSSTPGRVSLSLLTILTMQNQMSSTLSQLPKVSYIKLVDIWLTGCLAFVFAGFLEYALVNKLATREKEQRQAQFSVSQGLKTAMDGVTKIATNNAVQKKELSGNNQKECTNPSEESPMTPLNRFDSPLVRSDEKMSTAQKVDFYSRFLFPITFVLFNLVLWLCYLLPEESLH